MAVADVAAVAVGGVVGAAARHGVGVAVAGPAGGVPWPTLLVNVSGCLLLGALVAALEGRVVHRLVRPFLGTGVLGGYTTFSAATGETQTLLVAGRPLVGLAYLLGSTVLAVAGVWAGRAVTRRVRRPAGARGGPS